MGKGAAGLDRVVYDGTGSQALTPAEVVARIDAEITALRDELGDLLAELDRRRREAVDVKLQLRRHGLEAALTGVALVAGAVGVIWLKRWRARRHQGLLSRLGRLREGVTRMMDRPERVAAEPTLGRRILPAAATAAAAALARKGLERVVQRIQTRHAEVIDLDRHRQTLPPAKVA
jgi:hypothetical protein